MRFNVELETVGIIIKAFFLYRPLIDPSKIIPTLCLDFTETGKALL